MNIEEKMIEYKIGDEVVLNPETKPYTFLNCDGDFIEIYNSTEEGKVYRILKICADGDFSVGQRDNHLFYIRPRHIKHAKENNILSTLSVDLSINDFLKDTNMVELRLAIFNGNTSRTIEEMKNIEQWILGEIK